MPISAQRMNEFKQAIKDLMQYRNGLGPSNRKWTPSKPFGSLTEYGSDSYDFSTPAVTGGRVTLEQGQKTLNIVNTCIVTGNTEFLADAANFLMIEFMYPSIEGAKYTPTDNGACEIAGFSINEIREGKHYE